MMTKQAIWPIIGQRKTEFVPLTFIPTTITWIRARLAFFDVPGDLISITENEPTTSNYRFIMNSFMQWIAHFIRICFICCTCLNKSNAIYLLELWWFRFSLYYHMCLFCFVFSIFFFCFGHSRCFFLYHNHITLKSLVLSVWSVIFLIFLFEFSMVVEIFYVIYYVFFCYFV